MRLIGGVLYVGWDLLIRYGVSVETIHSGTLRHRQGKSKSWANVADPEDGRRCLVAYSSIPSGTLERYGLPSEGVLLAELAQGNKESFERVRAMLPGEGLETDRQVLWSWRAERESIDVSTGSIEANQQAGLGQKRIMSLLLEARYLRLIAAVATGKRELLRRLSVANVEQAISLISKCASEDGIKLPTNKRVLLSKVKTLAKEGISSLISKKFGNNNRRLVDEQLLAYMVSLYSHRQKPSFEDVWAQICAFCAQVGKPCPSLSTVKWNLMRPDVVPLWTLRREGRMAFKERYGYHHVTKKASAANALWVIDGTKVNLAYRVGNNRQARLTMVVVMDAFSECLLGWKIVEGSESWKEVSAAVRMAVERSGGILPTQFLYDNDGSNKLFFKRYNGLAFPAMPYNGESKPIESAFGRFQQLVLRGYPGFTGMNITASGRDSRIDFDSVVTHELPDKAQAIKLAEVALLEWNKRLPSAQGLSREMLYQESRDQAANTNGQMVSQSEFRQLFWEFLERPISYGPMGLCISGNGRKQWFEVRTPEGKIDNSFPLKYGNVSFHVKLDQGNANPQAIELYEKDSNGDLRLVAEAQAKRMVARAVADYSADERSLIEEGLLARRQQEAYVQDKVNGMQRYISSSFGEALLDPWGHHKETRLAAEAEWLEIAMARGGGKPMPAIGGNNSIPSSMSAQPEEEPKIGMLVSIESSYANPAEEEEPLTVREKQLKAMRLAYARNALSAGANTNDY